MLLIAWWKVSSDRAARKSFLDRHRQMVVRMEITEAMRGWFVNKAISPKKCPAIHPTITV
jgi:hypothetical protein